MDLCFAFKLPSLSLIDPIYMFFYIIDNNTAVYFAQKESKTCHALRSLFPNLENEITEYEKLKAKFDKDRATYGDAMKQLTTKWEIRVVVLLDNVKGKFKAFEDQAVKKFTPDMRPE